MNAPVKRVDVAGAVINHRVRHQLAGVTVGWIVVGDQGGLGDLYGLFDEG